MKTLRLLPLFALIIGLAASAFTAQKNAAPQKALSGYAYFVFTGLPTDDQNDPDNWDQVESPEGLCSQGMNRLCTIQAPIDNPSDQHPDFTGITNVQTSTVVYNKVYKP